MTEPTTRFQIVRKITELKITIRGSLTEDEISNTEASYEGGCSYNYDGVLPLSYGYVIAPADLEADIDQGRITLERKRVLNSASYTLRYIDEVQRGEQTGKLVVR